MTLKLTTRQRAMIDFIARFRRRYGYPPSIRDIVNGCNISSTSVVDYNLKILQKMGLIRRQAEISRGIELVGTEETEEGRISIPVIGQIAAGIPIPVPESDSFAVVTSDENIEVTEDLTRGRENIYALRVKGVSMIEDLINDGDLVIMQHTQTVDNGETAAVWLKDQKEVTLKKVYMEPGRVRLQPANRTMPPIYTQPDNVEIQGRVIAVIRQMD
ncbi:MAG: transcriptional repressor LexA [Dehalococcoides mccartyi]|uniref:LexA repressor n=3 Tax=root TaxID=1 RepID=D2BJW7_DEHMV|nr:MULTISPECIES: transcriptional repressor LexA [Dehalococcoides]ACZ62617.1 LexA repressor [Dehalococcoides mccartyi VS]AQU03765.1 repressor LexA [Dehalococcoides mccartyi]AQU05067.1 repressor LexA [Dehalococcoides mccartyi]KSV16267.1 LexA family transcriptional regulator [Dehalococcoides mccartyi]MBF4482400.1 repressor LexA [Dehalococcoides mccartyi]